MPARLSRCVQPGRDRAARAKSSPSTDRARTRSPTATSARRSGNSASASTDPIACSIPPSAAGRKGSGQFKRVTWDEAIELVAERFEQATADAGARIDPAVLLWRIERPADPGQHRRAALAPSRHLAPGAHGLRGADRRRQHGAVRQDAVGHLPGLPGSEADHSLGREPVRVGHPPHAVRARGAEARRQARRDRPADDAAGALGRHPSAPSGPAPTSPLRWRIHRHLFANGHADEAFLREHTHGAERCGSAPSRGPSRRRRRSPASSASALEALAEALCGRARRR